MPTNRFYKDFNTLLGATKPKSLAIAVSGGSDSIALLHLTSAWVKQSDIEIIVFSVNHNLRTESSEEISYVKNITQKLGHKFYELSWNCGENKAGLQERARQGRYDLMSEKCLELSIDTLLTAHHMDDMLETYLMRKAKKSGIFGLSSSNCTFYNNIRILRPLFNYSKLELIEYLQANDIMWHEDHTNQSDLYERNRIRKEIASLSKNRKIEIKNELSSINKRAAILNEDLIIEMAESLQINDCGFASIDLQRLTNSCPDIQIQILNYILTIISGKSSLPRFRSMEKLLHKLSAPINFAPVSLHGCILKLQNNKLWIFREKSAINSALTKFSDLSCSWDNRFDILSRTKIDHYIGKLTLNEYISIKDKINFSSLKEESDNNHKLILFTLPVIKNIEKVIAIPHISYYDDCYDGATIEVVFKPNFISRFTHFV